MAINPKIIVFTSILQMGKSIISSENHFYLESKEDDADYITRLKRIIESIKKELTELGLTQVEANALCLELREFAKTLFMKTWMQGIDEFEDKTEVWSEGSEEFESIYEFYQ